MNPGSPRTGLIWRGIALLFAVSVVMVRLGVAGCGPTVVGPTKAGKPAPANAPAAKDVNAASNPPPPDPDLSNPRFFPPTKAGGGFYSRRPPAPAPPQQAQPAQAPPKPGHDPSGGAQQAGEPR